MTIILDWDNLARDGTLVLTIRQSSCSVQLLAEKTDKKVATESEHPPERPEDSLAYRKAAELIPWYYGH